MPYINLIKKQKKLEELNSLKKKGWIMPYGDSEDRRKEYIITTLGKEIVKKELIRLDQLVSVANEIVGGAI